MQASTIGSSSPRKRPSSTSRPSISEPIKLAATSSLKTISCDCRTCFAGLPASPIHLRLQSEGDRFQFKLQQATVSHGGSPLAPVAGVLTALTVAPQQPASQILIDQATSLPARTVNLIHAGIRRVTEVVAS